MDADGSSRRHLQRHFFGGGEPVAEGKAGGMARLDFRRLQQHRLLSKRRATFACTICGTPQRPK